MKSPTTTTISIPGPRGLPIVGNMPDAMREGIPGYVTRMHRVHGDIFAIEGFRGDKTICVADPEAIDRIMRVNAETYPKGPAYDPMRDMMGEGLVTSDGERWNRQRKLILPVFRRSNLAELVPSFELAAREMVEGWERSFSPSDVFDIYPEITRLTRRIGGLTLFGIDLNDTSDGPSMVVMRGVELMMKRINSLGLLIPRWVPTPTNIRFNNTVRELDRVVYEIIERGRQDGSEHPRSLLRMLLEARDEETGEGLSTQQLRDEVVTFYVGGYETTALTLTWALYFLSRHHNVLERVEAEIDRLGDPEHLTLEHLDTLQYTRQVLDEALRLRTPAWGLARTALNDDVLGGYPVPGGTRILIMIFAAHHHPAYWPDPLRFEPDRFAPDAVKQRHRGAWLPFSAGPRACLGRAFGQYEALTVLARIIPRMRLQGLPGHEVGATVLGSLRPDRPVLMRMERRSRVD